MMNVSVNVYVRENDAASKKVWPYIALVKGYRCLDCCSLIDFEERGSYFKTKFCDMCRPLQTRMYLLK